MVGKMDNKKEIIVLIKSNSNATLRTKNRVRENGPSFIWDERIKNIQTFNGKCVLLKSIKNDWIGWIPVKEIVIVKQ